MSATDFFQAAKKQIAEAKAFTLTGQTYSKLSKEDKKIVCIFGDGYNGTPLAERHANVPFSILTKSEKAAIQYGLKKYVAYQLREKAIRKFSDN